jgi:serine/threonine-protein kinase
MGVVFKARQVNLNRVVALKVILGGRFAHGVDLARFRTEAEAIARLQHPNIMQVYELGEIAGQPFLSLELCAGGTLARLLGRGPLVPRRAAELVAELAGAIHHAHERGIVHRDLKPSNVLFAEEGVPKITDFGLARRLDEPGHTATGEVLGTPAYMAPEQAAGKKDVGPLTDVWALGAILYECLTGRPPFKAATAFETIQQVVSEDPAPPRQFNALVPRDLEMVCLKALAKEPGRRYASAGDMASDLRRFLGGDVIAARARGRWWWPFGGR